MENLFELPPSALDDKRDQLLDKINSCPTIILQAPPGSGKSTRLPLWLLSANLFGQEKILLLEPRRLAAKALARYLAGILNEKVGQSIGYRMRGESLVSAQTKLEIVTTGILTQMLIADSDLPNIKCVIFDEFHERSLDQDLALALLMESQAVLRPDLKIVIMSATLDCAKLTKILGDPPVIVAESRQYPVETYWQPPTVNYTGIAHLDGPFWDHLQKVILASLKNYQGSILVFLPGNYEINRLAENLAPNIPPQVDLFCLTRNTPDYLQDQAISQVNRRKVILATSIAETSLTIADISIVIDSGLARLMRYDPQAGIDRLVTSRVSLAQAEQRLGRAGRTKAGIGIRFWDRASEVGFLPQTLPEILRCDLSRLVLILNLWGVHDFERLSSLTFLDLPSKQSYCLAQERLRSLRALDSENRLTPLGEKMARLPIAPRLAAIVAQGTSSLSLELAIVSATLLEGIDGQKNSASAKLVDFKDLLAAFWAKKLAGQSYLENLALRLASLCGLKTSVAKLINASASQIEHLGRLLAAGFPDFVAAKVSVNAADGEGRYLSYQLPSGHRVRLDSLAAIEASQYLLCLKFSGQKPSEDIRLAINLDLKDLLAIFQQEICTSSYFELNAKGIVQEQIVQRLGEIRLGQKVNSEVQATDCQEIFSAKIRSGGVEALLKLPWSDAAYAWQARVLFLHEVLGGEWPNLTNEELLRRLDDWLIPLLTTPQALVELSQANFFQALKTCLPYALATKLASYAPEKWQLPSGIWHKIHYEANNQPYLEAKLQEFFGLTKTPTIANGLVPLTLHLNSPANHTLQITRDLEYFWHNGYEAVRREMQGRYPKHPWPVDPLTAVATRKTKKALQK